MKTPTTLIIMDGFGIEPQSAGNAVVNTPTPVLDHIFNDCPGCQLKRRRKRAVFLLKRNTALDISLP